MNRKFNTFENYRDMFSFKTFDNLWKQSLDTSLDKYCSDTTKVTRVLFDKYRKGEITNSEEKEMVEKLLKNLLNKYNRGEIRNDYEKQHISNLFKELKENNLNKSIDNFDDSNVQDIIQLCHTIHSSQHAVQDEQLGLLTIDRVQTVRENFSLQLNFDYNDYDSLLRCPVGTMEHTLGYWKCTRDLYHDRVQEFEVFKLFYDLYLSRNINEISHTHLMDLRENFSMYKGTQENCRLAFEEAMLNFMGKLAELRIENNNSNILSTWADKALLNYSEIFDVCSIMQPTLNIA